MPKITYETKEVVHCWTYDESGPIYTHVELYIKTVAGNPNSWDSPEDYYGYTEVVSYEVGKVTNEWDVEIDPSDFLEDNAKFEYNSSLSDFIAQNTKLIEG